MWTSVSHPASAVMVSVSTLTVDIAVSALLVFTSTLMVPTAKVCQSVIRQVLAVYCMFLSPVFTFVKVVGSVLVRIHSLTLVLCT